MEQTRRPRGPGKGYPPKTARNRLAARMAREGTPPVEIAGLLGVSRQRVHVILRQQQAAEGAQAR